MSTATKVPARMTVAEFLDWCPEDGQVWQLVDGEPMAMAPAGTTHGRIQSEIGRLLGNNLAETGSPCAVITAPGITPHLERAHNVRIPDLAVTCAPAGDDGRLLSAAVLVLEILSPSNHHETWANVRAYASIPSLREILVVSSVEVGADLIRRGDDGSWPEQPQHLAEGEIVLESIGFRCPLAGFYRTTHLAPAR
ncbi:MAG: Uma2 family endonuclease [Acetobacteraceae bacterium]